MKTLHVMTREGDDLARMGRGQASEQRSDLDAVVDLTGLDPGSDEAAVVYRRLVGQVFEAEAVHVW